MIDAMDPPTPSVSKRPMIVVEDAHVTYKVFAGGKPVGGQSKILGLRGTTTNEVHAVRGVTFTATEGESVGVLGHNGSGKSTLFRAMAGLIPTSQGQIYAADRPVLLGVNAALMPELSGENNIKLGLLAMGFTAEEAASQVDEIADFAELNEFINHPMRTYSSGMGARLRFAIASARPHSILLLDEALAVGDRRFRTKSEARIRNLRDAAGLVMIVSHSPGSLKETCERGLWIHKGELRADGPIRDVIAEYSQWAKDPKSVGVGASSADIAAAAARRKRVAARIARKAAAALATATPATAPGAAEATATTADSAGSEPPNDQTRQTAPQPTKVFTNEVRDPSTATMPVPVPSTTSPRDAARRARYAETTRTRRRRRTRAIALTTAAVLIAAGAGAAIALVAMQADRTESAELRATGGRTSTPIPTTPSPVINTFTAPLPAACSSTDGSVDIPLNWDASGVGTVSVAITGADGVTVPFADGLPATADAQMVPFSCSNSEQLFTLTITSESGEQVTATAKAVRELAPINEGPEPIASPEPVEEAPIVPTQPPETTEPIETTPPAPEAPGPPVEPTPSVEPTTEPEVPEPEPTDAEIPAPTDPSL